MSQIPRLDNKALDQPVYRILGTRVAKTFAQKDKLFLLTGHTLKRIAVYNTKTIQEDLTLCLIRT